MGIGSKIEEIRKKPEHIRERYVWFSVGICMTLIFGVWLVSFKATPKKNADNEDSYNLRQSLETFTKEVGNPPTQAENN